MNKIGYSLLIVLLITMTTSCDKFTSKSDTKVKKSTREISINAKGDTVITTLRKDGTLKSTITKKNGYRNGPSFLYYENGNIQFEINYTDGYKDSIVKYNYENGKIYRTTLYNNGIKHGIQTYYHTNGSIKAEVPYENNEVIPGTKEYTSSGKIISDYPKIKVVPIDKLGFENKYELHISLKPKKKKVTYYISKNVAGKDSKIMLEGNTKNGMAIQTYYLYPGHSLMEKVKVRAIIKSKRGIPIVLTKTYNLAVDNRNY